MNLVCETLGISVPQIVTTAWGDIEHLRPNAGSAGGLAACNPSTSSRLSRNRFNLHTKWKFRRSLEGPQRKVGKGRSAKEGPQRKVRKIAVDLFNLGSSTNCLG